MTRQELYNMLVRAKRPIDCFGEVKNETELKKEYRRLAGLIHPDTAKPKEEYISHEGFTLLGKLYDLALEEWEKGIYNLIQPADIYEKSEPMFTLTIHGKDYKIYEMINEGEIADIYRGLCDKQVVCLKLAVDEADNDLLKQEYETLNSYSHKSIPIVRDFIKINGCSAIVMDEIEGESLLDVMQRNPNGLPAEVLMWIMERLFSAVGYLHSNYIVHGNILPENIIIDKKIHNVAMTGFSFHIPKANEKGSHYQIKNEDFSAPEVSKSSVVGPESDIYSLGKLAIYMLGGSTYNNGMPVIVDKRVREFIRKMVEKDRKKRSNDAWKLWDEWIELRNKVYGTERFKQIEF